MWPSCLLRVAHRAFSANASKLLVQAPSEKSSRPENYGGRDVWASPFSSVSHSFKVPNLNRHTCLCLTQKSTSSPGMLNLGWRWSYCSHLAANRDGHAVEVEPFHSSDEISRVSLGDDKKPVLWVSVICHLPSMSMVRIRRLVHSAT